MRRTIRFYAALMMAFLFGGCQVIDPVLQERVDTAVQRAVEAKDRVDSIQASIMQIQKDYEDGKLTAESALPRILALKTDLSEAVGDVKAAYASAEEAKNYAKENGIPWWQIGISVALGALGTGGVLGKKYAGALNGIKTLVGSIETGTDKKDVKRQVEKAADPYVEAMVTRMQREIAKSSTPVVQPATAETSTVTVSQ